VRALVIGGTRFLGPYVVRALVAARCNVTVYHRGATEAVLPPPVRHVRDPRAAMPVLAYPAELFSPLPDVVVHMIPMGEADARASVQAFRGRTGRLIALGSGDVYRAYGRFTGLEPGPLEPIPLTESAALRSQLYPYRARAKSPDALEHYYEKILMERHLLGQSELPAVVLRLPKLYGPEANADFESVFAFQRHPEWRWTHGYVENVAAAIVLAATHAQPLSPVYNVGEAHTPTIAERIRDLPPQNTGGRVDDAYNFDQDIVFDTARIRSELAYAEPVPYKECLRRTLRSQK
jgi:nucleoside-diphosphate-sugar epimerase